MAKYWGCLQNHTNALSDWSETASALKAINTMPKRNNLFTSKDDSDCEDGEEYITKKCRGYQEIDLLQTQAWTLK